MTPVRYVQESGKEEDILRKYLRALKSRSIFSLKIHINTKIIYFNLQRHLKYAKILCHTNGKIVYTREQFNKQSNLKNNSCFSLITTYHNLKLDLISNYFAIDNAKNTRKLIMLTSSLYFIQDIIKWTSEKQLTLCRSRNWLQKLKKLFQVPEIAKDGLFYKIHERLKLGS